MIRRSFPLRQSVRASRAGFTLIELLTVIAIILVLAGLLLNVAGNANYKSSLARAQTEVKAMETGLEGYKSDNGTYPRNADTDALNAQPAGTSAPTDPGNALYTKSGLYLYQCLSGYTGSTYNKTYVPFKPSQLSTGTAAPSLTATWAIDPFGFCYGYSTANLKAQDTANSTNPPGTVDTTKGYNPTFDLWSTGGYGSGGKSYPSGATGGSAAVALWAKNW